MSTAAAAASPSSTAGAVGGGGSAAGGAPQSPPLPEAEQPLAGADGDTSAGTGGGAAVGARRAPTRGSRDRSLRRLLEVVVLPGARHAPDNPQGLPSLSSADALEILSALSPFPATDRIKSLNTGGLLTHKDDAHPGLKAAFRCKLRFGPTATKGAAKQELAGFLNVRSLDASKPAELGTLLSWVQENAPEGISAELLALFGEDGDGAATAATAPPAVQAAVRAHLECVLPLSRGLPRAVSPSYGLTQIFLLPLRIFPPDQMTGGLVQLTHSAVLSPAIAGL